MALKCERKLYTNCDPQRFSVMMSDF